MPKPPKVVAHLGDPHLFHPLVSSLRGYEHEDGTADLASHVEDVIDSIRATVPPRSILHLYGDLSMPSGFDAMLATFERLIEERNYKVQVKLGNHDKGHPINGKTGRHLRRMLEVFDEVDLVTSRSVNGVKTYASHFPAAGMGDHTDSERYAAYRIPSQALEDGSWLVHAHTHQDTPTVPERPQHICVSWEAARRPLLDADLYLLMSGKPVSQEKAWRRSQDGLIPALEEWRRYNGRWKAKEISLLP